MNTPLILPEYWKYAELLESSLGYVYVLARSSGHGVGEATIVQWAFDALCDSGSAQEIYRDRCNKHRIMYRRGSGEYEPMPDDIETMQQAVDYLHVLLRMES